MAETQVYVNSPSTRCENTEHRVRIALVPTGQYLPSIWPSLCLCFRNRKQMKLHARIPLTNLSALRHGCQEDAGDVNREHGNNDYKT